MNERTRRLELTAILRGSMGVALDWRLLTLYTATVLWTTLVATYPAWRVMASVFDDSPRASEIAGSFDLLAFSDMGMAMMRSAAPVSGGAAMATLLGVLSWPLLAGMAIGTARAGRSRTFAEALDGGIAYYARMFRLGLVAIVPFAIVAAVGAGVFRGARQFARHAILESQATLAWRAAMVVTVLVFVLLHATLEAGRAAFGADDDLRSGWSAWLRGVRLLGRDPIRVLGAYLGATLASFLIAAPVLVLRLRVSGPSGIALVVGFVLTQLAAATLGWGRTTRLVALTALARSHFGVSAGSSDASDETTNDARAVPSGSMFRELGPRKSIARRG